MDELQVIDRRDERGQWFDGSERKDAACRWVARESPWRPTVRLLAFVIIAWVDDDGKLGCSIRQLAKWTGSSPATVRRALRTLLAASGPLRIARHHRRDPATRATTTNVYFVSWEPSDG